MPDLYTAKTKTKRTAVSLSKPNALSSFSLRPGRVKFENQNSNEEIILLLRKHWVTNLGWIFFSVVLLFCPLVFMDFPAISILPVRYKIISLIGWYLILISFIFEKFLSWFFNVAIITNQRVIDVDFYGLLYKEITDAEINKIQDVTQKQVGAIRTVFDFGYVLVQTAGEKGMVDFEDIPHPGRVVKIIQDLT